MIAQVLDRVLTCHRIGDPGGRYPIFDAAGSGLAPGRWNFAETPLIYASEHFSTCLLEILANGGGMLPPHQHCVRITIPNGATYEVVDTARLKGWDEPVAGVSQAFGAAWAREARSLVLIAPSVVARLDNNVMINPAHPEFRRIAHGLHQPVYWDARLFR